MPRIKEGFKGERAIVLPAFLIEELKQDPLGSELYITDIGYYPHACFHYRKRNTEEATEFILIYCMEGEGWFELDKHRYVVTANQFFILPKHQAHAYGPYHNTGNEDNNHYKGSNTHDNLADRFCPLIGRRVHQPPMQFTHGLEERVTLGPTVHLSSVWIHA